MSHGNQHTVERSISLRGVGVHTGASSTLTFLPADPDHGIRFRRTDLEGYPEVPCDLDHVVGTELGTSVGAGEVRIMTVEHVMATLSALEIDNAVIELSGPEPPILDGSFRGYLEALEEAGRQEQPAPRQGIRLTEPVTVRLDSGEFYVAAPGRGLRVSATIEFEHPAVGRQFGTFLFSKEAFREEIAPARTFGFKADVESLHARGLALGASLENTVVLDEDSVVNGPLRFLRRIPAAQGG
jgi:UDP-3-O-acyl N-acetylglucosamine deacetylase